MVLTNDAERRIGHRETTWGCQWLAVSGESIGSDHREAVRVGYLGGAWFCQYRFNSVRDCVDWDAQVRALKIIHSELAFQSDADCESWLGLVADTAHKWGAHRFPPDVKSAANEVESRIGRPLTEWAEDLTILLEDG